MMPSINYRNDYGDAFYALVAKLERKSLVYVSGKTVALFFYLAGVRIKFVVHLDVKYPTQSLDRVF